MHRRTRALSLAAAAALSFSGTVHAQQPARAGWEVAGLPTVNFDSDEGFGYGATAELYRYAPGLTPYRFTIQPDVQLTSKGKRDITVFFDAPHLLGGGWRLDVFAGTERLIATPFYGLGNDSRFDPALETEDDPYFYRMGRTRSQVRANVQRPIGNLPLRVLAGVGAAYTEIDATPRDEGTTLLQTTLDAVPGDERLAGWSNSVRAGLVWDTRDREVGTRRGTWADVIVQRVDRSLGSDWNFWRVTLTDRHYVPVSSRVTLAQRVLVQSVIGDAPFFELSTVQSSYKPQEGLGGSKTLRGVPKNRFTGKSLALSNTEIRWRAADFRMAGKPFHVVTSAFVDAGRVWDGDLVLDQLVSGLHVGTGGGVRLGMGENFVVSLDVGHSREATAPFYIGLGYLY